MRSSRPAHLRTLLVTVLVLLPVGGYAQSLTNKARFNDYRSLPDITIRREGTYLNGGLRALSVTALETEILALRPSAWRAGRKVVVTDRCWAPHGDTAVIMANEEIVLARLKKHGSDDAGVPICM